MVTPRKRRYKVPGGRVRPANLHIKLTAEEKDNLERVASAQKMTLSAFARRALFGAQS